MGPAATGRSFLQGGVSRGSGGSLLHAREIARSQSAWKSLHGSNPKLKVDIGAASAYLQLIDICLLSFGYRASGNAPLNEPSFQKSLSPSAVRRTAVVQYAMKGFKHDHWHS
jgi:hypothetical protein